MKSVIGKVHEKFVFNRRVRVLVEKLGALMPPEAHVLDVGTGDGQIAKMIGAQSQGARIEGIDIKLRPETHIPVTLFDGMRIPMQDNSVDVVTFVDVMHHTDNPGALIADAARVARKAVIIKDHLSENALDRATLRAMDWVGNAPHGVVLPYNYASQAAWMGWFEKSGLEVDVFDTDVPLYAFPLSVFFGRKLHFLASLRPTL